MVSGGSLPGQRFYDWQLTQSPEESWRECHLQARNLLGQDGYYNLLGEVLRDTDPGGWSDALKFTCDLEEKQSLGHIFSIALGFLSPEVWEACIDEARTIVLDRKVTFEQVDKIKIAEKQAPYETKTGKMTQQKLFD